MLGRGINFCRCCNSKLDNLVLSLGEQPLSNLLPEIGEKKKPEVFPLEFRICNRCYLGQIGEFVTPSKIFSEYTYLSSTSKSWLNHAANYTNEVIKTLGLKQDDLVIEIASNDGYLLQYFQQKKFRVLGIEPARNVAELAIKKGIPTQIEFFTKDLALELIKNNTIPKLVICNNVLAHVPDINDFMAGLTILIKFGAIVTIEAPSMKVLLEKNLFDTIYHEHYSYLSVNFLDFITKKHEILLYRVEFLKSHGGSYRFWLGNENISREISVETNLENEFEFASPKVQNRFKENSVSTINNFREWCFSQRQIPIGFGAAAKATVLLNAANITNKEFAIIADNSLSKQKKMIPVSNIPISSPDEVFANYSSNLVIFPWNLSKEITSEIRTRYPLFSNEIWVPLPEMTKVN